MASVAIVVGLNSPSAFAAPDTRPIERVPSPYNPELQPVVDSLPEMLYEGHRGDPIAEGTTRNERAIKVYSRSMKRYIGLHILLPVHRNKPAPVLYMLNGAGGGEDAASWQASTDIRQFFADKQVYVVTVIGGALSYYTDWVKRDKKYGLQKWETFLRFELPKAVEGVPGKLAHVPPGKRGLLGMSMTGTTVPSIATLYPGFWKFIGSFSGCPQTADPVGATAVGIVLAPAVMGGNVDNMDNMWGPQGSPEWVRHDPVMNAKKLVGQNTSYYFYSGLGLPGKHDNFGDPFMQGDQDNKQLLNQMLVGGLIEVNAGACTYNLKQRFAELGIPATFVISGKGTHSWGYWQDNLHRAWPQIKRALGA